MPRQDGTGPNGQGAMTGRGLGPCKRGMDKEFCRRMGWRCLGRFPYNEPVNLTKIEEKKILEAEIKEMDLEKQEIEKRLKEIE